MRRASSLIRILAILALSGLIEAQPQPPDTLWTQTYGDIRDDYGYCVQQATDRGFIIVGNTVPHNSFYNDIYLIKTDSLGSEIWSQTFGGSQDDWGLSVQQTNEGGYIITGTTNSYGFIWDSDIFLLKTDGLGNEIWTQIFGWSNSMDCAYCVQQTTDGGYIIAGHTEYMAAGEIDVFLVKTDESGNEVWSQVYGYNGVDIGRCVQQTSDGGYILVGYTEPSGPSADYDVYLIKTDSQGNETWSQTFGGADHDFAYEVKQTTDGGYIIVGIVESWGTWFDVYMIKTDGSGDMLWWQTFGGSSQDRGYSVIQTADGGYIVAGWTLSFGVGGSDVYLIRTDGLGNQLWFQTIGGSYIDHGYCIQHTTDGGFIIAGYSSSFGVGHNDYNVYLIRLAPETIFPNLSTTLTPYNPPIQVPSTGGSFDFNVVLENSDPGPVTFDAWIMVQLPDLTWFDPVLGPVNLTLPGLTTIDRDRTQNVPAGAPSGTYTYEGRIGNYPDEIWHSDSFTFEKLETGDGVLVYNWANTGESLEMWFAETDAETPSNFELLSVHPNPFNPTTTISFALPQAAPVNLSIYDISGRLVSNLIDGWRQAGNCEVTFDGSGLVSGIYIMQLQAKDFNASKKLVLMK